jgi:hypothetical protein
MLRAYLRLRERGEKFQQFTQRHDLRTLQEIFTE